MADYELADFRPDDGHLHRCEGRQGSLCDCASHLFAIAQDEALRTEHVGWVRDDGDAYHDFRYASHADRAPGVAESIVGAGYLPVFVRTDPSGSETRRG